MRFAILLLAGVLCLMSGITADEDAKIRNPVIYSDTGTSLWVNLLCETEETKPISLCTWTKREDGRIYRFSEDDITGDGNKRQYGYFGEGFMLGQCGIQFIPTSDAEFGLWDCVLKGNSDWSVGTFQVKRWETPNKANISMSVVSVNDNGFTVNVDCCSTGGIPPPQLSLTFAGDKVKDAVTVVTPSNVCTHWPNRHFTADDNMKKIECEQKHISFSNRIGKSIVYNQTRWISASLDLNLTVGLTQYAPEITKEEVARVNETTSVLQARVIGNPLPTISWGVLIRNDTTGTLHKYAIDTSNEKYNQSIQRVGIYEFCVMLTINNVTDGYFKLFELHATNSVGDAIYVFNLDDTVNSGPSLWTILGFGLFAVFIVGCFAFLFRCATNAIRGNYTTTNRRTGLSVRADEEITTVVKSTHRDNV